MAWCRRAHAPERQRPSPRSLRQPHRPTSRPDRSKRPDHPGSAPPVTDSVARGAAIAAQAAPSLLLAARGARRARRSTSVSGSRSVSCASGSAGCRRRSRPRGSGVTSGSRKPIIPRRSRAIPSSPSRSRRAPLRWRSALRPLQPFGVKACSTPSALTPACPQLRAPRRSR